MDTKAAESPDGGLVPVVVNEDAAAADHATLKYSLLGPSLTKAGQGSVDQSAVSEVIYNASKGSKFFNHEEERDKNLTSKIEKILVKKRHLEEIDLYGATAETPDRVWAVPIAML